MTMYFVQTPKANQILKTCYSLTILTVVLACCTLCLASGETRPQQDGQQHQPSPEQQVANMAVPADTHSLEQDSGTATGRGADLHKAAATTNTKPDLNLNPIPSNNYNNINLSNNNDNNNNNKLIINPNAGAKSLEEKEDTKIEEEEEGEEAEKVVRNDKSRSDQQKQQQPQVSGNSNQIPSGQQANFATLRKDTLHKLMSENDLRRTFQVDTHDQVPEYQVLKLTVSHDGSHLISPISDLGELLMTTTTTKDNHRNSAHQEHEHQPHEHDQRPAAATVGHELESQLDKERPPDSTRTSASQEDVETSASRVKRSTPTSNSDQRQQQFNANHQDERLIVMNLSTFGQDFSLRLKRNADFQQRIKDMKMFMAESTSDGQLRYTEIKNPNFHQQHHKQEPHKRAASNDAPELADLVDHSSHRHQQVATDVNQTSQAARQTPQAQLAAKSGDHRPAAAAAATGGSSEHGQPDKKHDWNIGSTYHDEENLAALLIERDRQTGQIKVDGTIGNDFVIKPMPRATIEALMAKQRERESASSGKPTVSPSTGGGSEPSAANAIDLSRLATDSSGSTLKHQQVAPEQLASSANELRQAAGHMHDDDPHDDDEMFLDEDEALELANNSNQTSRAATNSTAPAASLPQQQQQQQQQQQARVLSKAASERKWKKYRKLMAQTQVPKPADQHNNKLDPDQSQSSNQEQRARRHLASGASSAPSNVHTRTTTTNSSPQHLHMSHHIVYRQRPSSEASSSEHKHSFMMAPGQQSMEAMARQFPSEQRMSKRSAGDNRLDTAGSSMHRSRLLHDQMGVAEADYAHDPLGGQFYLEPGSITGFERAGYADWSLVSSSSSGARRAALAAPPPYAFNSSNDDSAAYYMDSHYQNSTGHLLDLQRHAANSTHQRFKRHLGRSRTPGGPRSSAASSHRAAHVSGASASNRRHKRQAPDVVWPEVLLVVDYDSFLLHGGDSREVKRYFVSFWNGVDLRYKLLVNPHIRISLAGMIVAKDRDATPYLERNRLRAPNADAVDAAGALTDMGKYLYREDRLPTYDLAVVITKLDMCRRRYEGGRCNRGTAGFAYVGGACVVNKRLEKVNSVAIIEDSGGFSGIIVAAHEVGHLLGCVHDGSPPPSYLGGPGATHCPWEDGYIMSDLRHTDRGFRWSSCSVEQFKHFLNGETATCLYNYPHESQMLHRLLPGSMLSLDDQCKRDRGTNACFKDARVCAQLFCFDSASGYCVSYRPAAEGSPCGDGHVCRNGKCVGEIENIIPDYTHQSQTVVAAGGGAVSSRQRSLSVPSVAAAGVSSALVAPPPPPSPRLLDNGLSASSTSTATSSPESGTAASSGKLVTAAASGPSSTASQQQQQAPVSSRRMDTVQVDTPTVALGRQGHLYQPTSSRRSASSGGINGAALDLNQFDSQHQSLPFNYHHQHLGQATSSPTSSAAPKHLNYQSRTGATSSLAYTSNKPGSGQYASATSSAATRHNQEQLGGAARHQLHMAAYSDPFAYSSQRKREPASTMLKRSSEPYAAASSSPALPTSRSSANHNHNHNQSTGRSTRRAYRQQQPDAGSASFATSTYNQQLARATSGVLV